MHFHRESVLNYENNTIQKSPKIINYKGQISKGSEYILWFQDQHGYQKQEKWYLWRTEGQNTFRVLTKLGCYLPQFGVYFCWHIHSGYLYAKLGASSFSTAWKFRAWNQILKSNRQIHKTAYEVGFPCILFLKNSSTDVPYIIHRVRGT